MEADAALGRAAGDVVLDPEALHDVHATVLAADGDRDGERAAGVESIERSPSSRPSWSAAWSSWKSAESRAWRPGVSRDVVAGVVDGTVIDMKEVLHTGSGAPLLRSWRFVMISVAMGV
nr:hypothetical protein GCM10020093_106580 [Planobispora longispora]